MKKLLSVLLVLCIIFVPCMAASAQGETLSFIAKKYNTSVKELCRLNGITERSTLRIGQILKHN